MNFSTPTGFPFDPDNRAWQRFTDLISEHLNATIWAHHDGRPALATLSDLDSGDTFTIAIVDSFEVREPHVLLVFTTTGALTTHGPFDNAHTAAKYAPHLAMTDTAVAATRPAALHHPGQSTPPEGMWLPVPPELADVAHPDLIGAPGTALVLLDHARHLLAAIGPFSDHAAAGAWCPDTDIPPTVQRLIVALQTPTFETPDGGDATSAPDHG